jgi:zinc/manganese transport system permease protein
VTDALIFLAPPMVLAILLVGIHAYLGLHVLARDVIFVDISLSQVAALGGALSLFFVEEKDRTVSLAISLVLCLIVAFLLSLLRHYEKKISQEALIGITYALASGSLILVVDKLPHGGEHLKEALVGNILFVTWPQVLETAIIYAVIGMIHFIWRRQFWAASNGTKKSFFWDFLFYLLFGVVITFSTHHAGVLVVFSILVVPAALACRLFSGVARRLAFAWIFGALGVLISFLITYKFDLPAGAGIVTTLTAGFFVILATLNIFEGSSRED